MKEIKFYVATFTLHNCSVKATYRPKAIADMLTFDEWVEYGAHKDYRSSYRSASRAQVLSALKRKLECHVNIYQSHLNTL